MFSSVAPAFSKFTYRRPPKSNLSTRFASKTKKRASRHLTPWETQPEPPGSCKSRRSLMLFILPITVFFKFVCRCAGLPIAWLRSIFDPYSTLRLNMAARRRKKQRTSCEKLLTSTRLKLEEYEREKWKCPFNTGYNSKPHCKLCVAKQFIFETEQALERGDYDEAIASANLAETSAKAAVHYLAYGFSELDIVGY